MTVVSDRLRRCGIVAIVRVPSLDDADAIIDVLIEAGIEVLEFTLDSPDALRTIERAATRTGSHAAVGAGTVLEVAEVEQAAEAGAAFCVSPDTEPGVIARTVELGLTSIPGAFSPTEIRTALRAGADLVKLFPAGTSGPSHLRALRGPFLDVPFVPTGGIGLDDLASFRAAGATAVGLGSALVRADGNARALRRRSERAVAAWRGAS